MWEFIQNQLLKMQFLSDIIEDILIGAGVDVGSRIGGSIHFWLYDTIKIFILLSVLIFTISIIESYFPPEKCRRIIGKFGGIGANTMAALLGTVTPFCSCSSIPVFIGFNNAGFPVGVTFSFLISSPLVDLGSLILLSSIFGVKTAAVYVISGVIIAVIGGTVIEKTGMEKYLEKPVDEQAAERAAAWENLQSHRVEYAKNVTLNTIKKLYVYIFIGVGVGAVIHNWIPQSFIEAVLGEKNIFSVVIAVLVGIPMYADIFGTIPVAEALYFKGVGLGTVLSFMMAVTALSLPSIIMLKQAVKPKLLKVFVLVVTVGIIFTGYMFNAFQGVFM